MPQGARIVTSFEDELGALDNKIAEMGGLAERQLDRSYQALNSRDNVLAEQAIASDRVIDNHERDIEAQAIAMIGRRQPLAQDLRQIAAAMKMSGDLERICDLAKNIAKRALVRSSRKADDDIPVISIG